MKDVPYIVFETELARLERIIKREFLIIVIVLIMLVGTNACWLYYESQFETFQTVTTQEADTNGGNAIINSGGDVNYGEGEISDDNTK